VEVLIAVVPLTNDAVGLGRSIRIMRKMARLTQKELASRCGLERTSITNIELGQQELKTSTITAIADALGYSVHVTFRRKFAPSTDAGEKNDRA